MGNKFLHRACSSVLLRNYCLEHGKHRLFRLSYQMAAVRRGVTKIISLPLNVFRKSATCPRSEDLLALTQSKLSFSRQALIEAHLEHCEFCRAELQLLGRYRPQSEVTTASEIPLSLRQLAEYLLPKRPFTATPGRRRLN